MPNVTDSMLSNLRKIRDMYGEKAYRYAAAQSLRMVIAQEPDRKADILEALKDIPDLEELLKEPPPYPGPKLPSQDQLLEAVKASMPGIQTQAQLNVVLASFDALRSFLNATFLGQKDEAEEAKEAVLQALVTAEKVTELSVKLNQVPEAASSKESEAFKKPPAEFEEHSVLQTLLEDLSKLESLVELNTWYADHKLEFDRVVSQSCRNALFDAIRQRKAALKNV